MKKKLKKVKQIPTYKVDDMAEIRSISISDTPFFKEYKNLKTGYHFEITNNISDLEIKFIQDQISFLIKQKANTGYDKMDCILVGDVWTIEWIKNK